MQCIREADPRSVYAQVDHHPACSSSSSTQTASALSLRHRGMTLLTMTELAHS